MSEGEPTAATPRTVVIDTLRSDVVRRVTVAVVLGGLAFAITSATTLSLFENLLLGLLLGSITLLGQFLVAVERELVRLRIAGDARFLAIETDLEQRFRAFGDAADLQSRVARGEASAAGIDQIVATVIALDDRTPNLVKELCGTTLAAVANEFSALSADLMVRYDGDDRDRLLRLTRAVERSLDAITLIRLDDGGGFDTTAWTSDLGSRYLQAQEQVVGRSRRVSIRRLFAVNDPAVLDHESFRVQCLAHAAIGAQVKVVSEHEQQDHVQQWIQDLVIFDGEASYEKTPLGRRLVETRIYFGPGYVAERVRQFDVLWDLATRPTFLPIDETVTP